MRFGGHGGWAFWGLAWGDGASVGDPVQAMDVWDWGASIQFGRRSGDAGSIEKAKATKNDTWVISYSTGELGSLQAHLDALTGEVLMAFLIPEG